jgi:hypothetical protein
MCGLIVRWRHVARIAEREREALNQSLALRAVH